MSRARLAMLALAALAATAMHAGAQDAGVPTPPPASADVLAPGAPVDFDIEETSGEHRSLHAVRGRVVMVWYEDREHTDTNHDLKLELHEFVQTNHLSSEVTTYGVANVSGITGVVRDLARTAIRAMASQYGIQILLDWDGVLMHAPFDCADHDANFVLVDRQGRMRYRHVGRLEGASRAEMYRVLRRLVHEPRP